MSPCNISQIILKSSKFRADDKIKKRSMCIQGDMERYGVNYERQPYVNCTVSSVV